MFQSLRNMPKHQMFKSSPAKMTKHQWILEYFQQNSPMKSTLFENILEFIWVLSIFRAMAWTFDVLARYEKNFSFFKIPLCSTPKFFFRAEIVLSKHNSTCFL